ncbi:OmpA family protein [Neisseriaceae bacterium B1]
MNKTAFQFVSAALLGSLLMPATHARVFDGENTKIVNGVKWSKTRHADVHDLLKRELNDDSVHVFFLRPADKDGIQTSANVAINDRFQASLQPGNFTDVLSCSGNNRISAEITGNKNNDLLKNAKTFRLDGRQSYFFMVDVDEAGKTAVARLSQEQAVEMMEKMPYQNHQITRVVPNCLPEAENLSIELKVYFDTDKSFVKRPYYPEIEQVVDYMKRFPDVKVTLEGHTDSRASDQYNIALSQRRVDAIRTILIDQYGIDANRIRSVGYGETRPIADNNTVEGRALNRRVMAVFEKQ